MVFQSLRGLGVGWNGGLAVLALFFTLFQSLRGLGVGWNGVASNWWGGSAFFNP